MRCFSVCAVVVALLVLNTGACTLFQKGLTIVKYEPGEIPRVTTTPEDGIFSLYSSHDTHPKVVHSLKRGEEIGFREDSDGGLFAVAGSHAHEMTIEKAHRLYWRMSRKN